MALVKLATANISLAVAILAINTPAPALATPAVLAPPVAENIRNVLVRHLILGTAPPAPAQVLINTPAPAPATPVAPALPVAANIPLAPAPLAMSGKMVVAGNKHRMEQLASCIIAMAKLLVYVLQVWASMSR